MATVLGDPHMRDWLSGGRGRTADHQDSEIG
jgi:hypothetical protein